MSSAPVPGANIPVRSLPNLRDLGGYATADGGSVKRGQLYRSVMLGRLRDEDISLVEALGLKTIFDFRTVAEYENSPDREVGARAINLDVLADRTGEGPAGLLAKMGDPEEIRAALAGGQGAEMMRTAYRELIELPSANVSYRTFFVEVAAAENLPALFHCTTGKDRTGWAAASTLLFLGVGEEDVYRDYLETNRQLLPAIRPLMKDLEEAGIEFELLKTVAGVDRSYLATALETMKERYGSIEGYMREGLELDTEVLAALRTRLLAS